MEPIVVDLFGQNEQCIKSVAESPKVACLVKRTRHGDSGPWYNITRIFSLVRDWNLWFVALHATRYLTFVLQCYWQANQGD